MEKEALKKEFWMEIRKSKNRFLSIFLIVALGVSFFAGVRSAEPAMYNTVDQYTDENRLMDLQIVGTLGFADADLEALNDVEGVSYAEGAWSKDVLCGEEGEEQAVTLLSISERLNLFTVKEGRLPQETDEIFLDTRVAGEEYQIGDTISFHSGTEEELSESLSVTEYRVVGLGYSPLYIGLERGSTNIGSGSLTGFGAVLPEVFDQSVYTRVYVRAQKSAKENCFDEAYDEIVSALYARLESMEEEFCQARYDAVRGEAESQLADAEEEWREASQEAEEQLADAREELDQGFAELESGEAELESQEAALEEARATYESRAALLEEGQEELAEQSQALADTETMLQEKSAELANGEAQLQSAREQLAAGQAMIAQNQQQLDAGEAQLNSAAEEIAANEAYLNEQTEQLQAAITQFEAGQNELNTKEAELAAAEQLFADSRQQLTDAETLLQEKSAQLAAAEEQLVEGQAELDQKLPLLNLATAALNQAQNSVQSGMDTLAHYQELLTQARQRREEESELLTEEQRQAILEEVASLEQQVADSQATVDALNEVLVTAQTELASAQEQVDAAQQQITDGQAQVAEGKQQLEAAQAELDEKRPELEAAEAQAAEGRTQLEAAKAELAAYQEQLTDAQNQLNAGWEQLNAGKSELAAGQQQIADGKNQLAAASQQLADNQNQLAAAEAEVNSGKSQLADGSTQIESGKSQIGAAMEQLGSAQAMLEAGADQLEEGEAAIEDAKAQLADARTQLEEGEAEYESQKADAESRLQEAWEEIEAGYEEVDQIEMPVWYLTDRNDLPGYSDYADNAGQIGAIGEIFPLLFFLVAALVALTTMTRMVEEQRTQIGTLKALGYSKLDIAGKYLRYALYATLGGSIFGVLIGELLFPFIIVTCYEIMYQGIGSVVLRYQWDYALLATAGAVFCTLAATLSACYRELSAQPAQLMRPAAPKAGKRVFLERIPALWSRFSFNQKASIRNLLRYKKRFFMTIIGIGGCMGLMVVGFGLSDSIMDIGELQYGTIQRYDVMLAENTEAGEAEKEALAERLDEEERIEAAVPVMMKSMDVTSGQATRTAYVMVAESASDLEGMVVFRDRVTHESCQPGSDGVVLTEQMANALGVSAGDTVTLKSGEKSVRANVAAVTENYLMHYVYMTEDYYEKLYSEQPDYEMYLLKLTEEGLNEEETLGQQLVEEEEAVLSMSYVSTTKESIDTMLNSLNIIVFVLVISAALLAFIVLYNLNNINISERRRELATIKLLGFYDGEVASYVFRENVYLTLIGAFLGIFIGMGLHQFIIQTIEVSMVMFGRQVKPLSFLICVGLTLLFSFLINGVMYFQLKKIDMVESLKSVE